MGTCRKQRRDNGDNLCLPGPGPWKYSRHQNDPVGVKGFSHGPSPTYAWRCHNLLPDLPATSRPYATLQTRGPGGILTHQRVLAVCSCAPGIGRSNESGLKESAVCVIRSRGLGRMRHGRCGAPRSQAGCAGVIAVPEALRRALRGGSMRRVFGVAPGRWGMQPADMRLSGAVRGFDSWRSGLGEVKRSLSGDRH